MKLVTEDYSLHNYILTGVTFAIIPFSHCLLRSASALALPVRSASASRDCCSDSTIDRFFYLLDRILGFPWATVPSTLIVRLCAETIPSL